MASGAATVVAGFGRDCLVRSADGALVHARARNRRVQAVAGDRVQLAPFEGLGYRLVELSAMHDASPLLPLLAGERTLLAGQSGMGKSTLVRRLVPHAEVRIRDISRALDAGRQGTTASRLYALDERSEIVDTPGMSEFGLSGLAARDIAAGFREFAAHASHCRFADCRHLAEPGCAVAAAAARGTVHPRRLELYRRIASSEGAA